MIQDNLPRFVEATVYCSSITSCTLAWLDLHGAGVAAVIAIVSFFINLYFKNKTYQLEKRKLGMMFSSERDNWE